MEHLAARFREGRISVADFDELQDWLDSDPDVPQGMWYKRFERFTLAGEGELAWICRAATRMSARHA